MRPPLSPTTIRRFWESIERVDGHWLWRGLTSRDGYGQTRGLRQAHRVALEIARGGPLPADKLVLHSPQCGHRNCVNPAHLRLGTPKQNAADKRR